MKIILENVQIGLRTTGVAKIMNGAVNVNNVPFDVGSKAELNSFVTTLLEKQAEFAGVTNGEYTPTIIPVKEIDPIEKAKNDVYQAKQDLELKIITELEYNDIVATYKALANEK